MLVSSYVVFAVLLVVSLLSGVGALVLTIHLAGAPTYKDLNTLIDDPDGRGVVVMNDLRAWVEGLDNNYNVVTVRGVKLDQATYYTGYDLQQMLNLRLGDRQLSDTDIDYIGILREAEPGAQVSYWLIKVPASSVNVQLLFRYQQFLPGYGWMLGLGVVALFAANCAIFALFLARRIKRPLSIIGSGLDHIRSGQPVVQLAPFTAQVELVAIRDSFNYMARELYWARREKEELEERRNQLLIDLSHDVKTPISTIKACAKALESGMVPKEKRQAYFDAIDAKGDQVRRLADDLIVVLSMESTDFAVAKQTVDPAELFRTSCVTYLDEVEARGLTLDVDIPDDARPIQADRNLLARVLENLLSNALKYNTTGQQIRATLDSRPNAVLFSVADDGDPIPEQYRQSIFDVFVRVDQSRSTDGSGLGLAICKGIVERHGGVIEYVREVDWNEFRVWLPTS
ncbi:MAG: HAMP domain-containing histidine kinase [Propionibacteriaceae bacterium]|jgi:signal transduction histidine kinase|nr:HAMP domain-containing histidine kinase [Propionibacteriaceae bacterium]